MTSFKTLSALAENEKYLESIAGKLSLLKAEYESLSNAVISSDLIKFVVDGGKTIVGVLNSIASLSSAGFFSGIVGGATALFSNTGLFDRQGFMQSKETNIGSRFLQSTIFGQMVGNDKSDAEIFSQIAKDLDDASKKGKIFAEALDTIGPRLDGMSSKNRESAKSFFSHATDYKTTIDGANKQADALKKIGIQQKLNAIGAKAMNIAVNAALSFGIGLAIEGIVKGITYLATAQKRAIEAGKELQKSLSESKQKLEDNKKAISEFSEEFEKLSKGVGIHGEQLGLTNEQYDRYHEIANQIAVMFPDLVAGWDAQGDAILRVGTSLDLLIEKQEEALRNHREELIANTSTTLKADYNEVTKQSFWNGSSELNKVNALEKFINLSETDRIKFLWSMQTGNFFKPEDSDEYMSAKSFKGSFGEVMKDLDLQRKSAEGDQEYYDRIVKEFDTVVAKYKVLSRELEQSYSNTKENAIAHVQNSDEYKFFDDEAKSIAQTVINKLDASFYAGFKDDTAKYLQWITSDIIETLNDPNLKTEILNSINALLSPDEGLNVEEFQSYLENAFNSLPDTYQQAYKKDYELAIDGINRDLKPKLETVLGDIWKQAYTLLSVEDIKISLNPEFEFTGSSLDELRESIAEFKKEISSESVAQREISTAITEYNLKAEALNMLWAEQEMKGSISPDTYEFVKQNISSLTDSLEVLYDELGNATGEYVLSEDKLNSFKEAQFEAAYAILIANNATAEQIALFEAYQGDLGTLYERIDSLVSKNNELAEAYTKANHNDKFTYESMMKLKEAYPELIFELDKATGKYNLYPESAKTLIETNAAMIMSITNLKLQLVELRGILSFMSGIHTKEGALNTVNAVKGFINKSGATTYEEYLLYHEITELPQQMEDFVTDYLAALQEVNNLPTVSEMVNALLGEKENEYNSSNKTTAFEGFKKQLDLEKSAIEAKMKLDPAFVVYNIQTMEDYYNKLRSLAKTAYEAQEIDAIEYQQYVIESFKGLRQIIADNYAESLQTLETERSKYDTGMKWDTSLFKDLAEYYDRIEQLNEERYEKDLISTDEYAKATVEIFKNRNDMLDTLLSDYAHDIMLMQNQDSEETGVNDTAIIDNYRIMQSLVHAKAEEFRESMSGLMTDIEIEHSDTIKNLQTKWWDYENNIQSIMESAFERGLTAYQDYISRRNTFAIWGADNEIAAWKRAMNFIESSYENGIISYKTYQEKRLEILESTYNAEKQFQQDAANAAVRIIEKELDELEKLKQGYEEQKSNYETTVSTVVDFIDEQIEKLQTENDELDKQLQLQKAIQAVELARNQKNKRVFREGVGFVWEADYKAINEAQESLDDLVRKSELQEQIDALEAYKKAWQATVDDYQKNLDRQITAEVLGANWEKQILNMRTDNMREYAAKYAATCDQLNVKVDDSVAQQMENLQELRDKWSASVDEIELEINRYEELIAFEGSFQESGYAGRLEMLDIFKDESIIRLRALQDEAAATVAALDALAGVSYESQVTSQMQRNAKAWWDSTDEEKQALSDENLALGTALGWYRDEATGIWYKSSGVRAFASGGVADYTGLAMLHGKRNEPELILNNNDASYLYNILHNRQNPDTNRMINKNDSDVRFTIGKIDVHGVQNVDDFVNEVVTNLPQKMLQKIYRKN